jgi:hypothetical protein
MYCGIGGAGYAGRAIRGGGPRIEGGGTIIMGPCGPGPMPPGPMPIGGMDICTGGGFGRATIVAGLLEILGGGCSILEGGCGPLLMEAAISTCFGPIFSFSSSGSNPLVLWIW